MILTIDLFGNELFEIRVNHELRQMRRERDSEQ